MLPYFGIFYEWPNHRLKLSDKIQSITTASQEITLSLSHNQSGQTLFILYTPTPLKQKASAQRHSTFLMKTSDNITV